MYKTIIYFFILLSYLHCASTVSYASSTPILCQVVNVKSDDVLNIRATANFRSQKLGSIGYQGHTIKKLGPEQTIKTNTWFQIQYQQITGWVNSRFLSCQLTSEKAKKAIKDQAEQVILALKDNNLAALARYVHPLLGVRFSPYVFVDVNLDQRVPANQLEKLLTQKSAIVWGSYDGSGEPINIPVCDYLRLFVYSHDFANAHQVSYNQFIKTGNTINNIRDIYHNPIIVEYYIPNSDVKKMDWSSLHLVFEKFEQSWYLVGIVHDAWTI